MFPNHHCCVARGCSNTHFCVYRIVKYVFQEAKNNGSILVGCFINLIQTNRLHFHHSFPECWKLREHQIGVWKATKDQGVDLRYQSGPNDALGWLLGIQLPRRCHLMLPCMPASEVTILEMLFKQHLAPSCSGHNLWIHRKNVFLSEKVIWSWKWERMGEGHGRDSLRPQTNINLSLSFIIPRSWGTSQHTGGD